MNLIQSLKFLFKSGTKTRIKILYDQINKQQSELRKLKSEYDELQVWYLEYYNMLNKLTVDMEAAVWSKNANHEYVIANPIHCREFFGIHETPDCLKYVRGKTDDYLINRIYKDNGFKNTFGEISTLSDKYTEEVGETTSFIEAGYIDDEQVLFYVIKFPQYDKDGKFTGTNGIGWNFTNKSNTIINMLNRAIYDKKVKTIYCKDDVFCHALDKEIEGQCDIFKHICPNPEKLRIINVN